MNTATREHRRTRVWVAAPLTPGTTATLDERARHHLLNVLRLREGAALTLFDGRGGSYAATLERLDKRLALAAVGGHDPADPESPLAVTLVQGVSRGERMDYTLQKAVELGVSAVVPVLTERTGVQLDAARWAKRREHWQGIVIGACEQSGRNRLPELRPPQRLEAWLDQPRRGLALVLDPLAEQGLRSLTPAAEVELLIGPEGGLSPAELTAAQRAGYTGLCLGPRVLRTETAGVAALSALQALWGDLG